MTDKLKYSTNWNNKLNCKYHTTFRMHNPKRFFPGKRFIEELNGKPVNRVKVLAVYPRQLNEVTNLEAYHDTGYSLPQFKKIVTNMYKNKTHVPSQLFDLVLLEVQDSQQTLIS